MVFRAGAVVFRGGMFGEDDGFDVATYGEVGDDTHPAGREEGDEVVEDGVGCGFVTDLAVAILVDVEFEAL